MSPHINVNGGDNLFSGLEFMNVSYRNGAFFVTKLKGLSFSRRMQFVSET